MSPHLFQSLETRRLMAADADTILQLPDSVSQPAIVGTVGDHLLFTAYSDADGLPKLFRTDGTSDGTQLIRDDASSVIFGNLMHENGKEYLTVDVIDSVPLGDGTCEITQRVTFQARDGELLVDFQSPIGGDCGYPLSRYSIQPKGFVGGRLVVLVLNSNNDISGPAYLVNGPTRDTWTQLADVGAQTQLILHEDTAIWSDDGFLRTLEGEIIPLPFVPNPPEPTPPAPPEPLMRACGYDFVLDGGQIYAQLGETRYSTRLAENGIVNAVADRFVFTDGRDILSREFTPGDVNLDGFFDSDDLVELMARGHYEDAIDGNSNHLTGDFNGDGDFTSADLIDALATGRYRD